MHHAYVALAPGHDRFACLQQALALLGWELGEHRRARGPHELPEHTVAWEHLPEEPATPGLLRIGGAGWDPRLVWALSQASGQFAVARLDDRVRDNNHFAVAYAGVPLIEHRGDEDENFAEFYRLVRAAADLDPLLFRAGDTPEAEVVSYVPAATSFEPVAELARVLVADVTALEPPPGWAARTGDPYGTPYVALQRRGPLDDALLTALAARGEVMGVHVAAGGHVRWRHLGGGQDAAGEGTGWEPITDAWEAHAPAAYLPPPEIDWPPA
jgi:hypothetical protein